MTQLKQGARFRCKIEGTPIEGKIQFDHDSWYLCQNKIPGSPCNDKLGYKYSWLIDNGTPEDLKRYDVTDLELLPDNDEPVIKMAESWNKVLSEMNDEPVMGDLVEVSDDGVDWSNNHIYTGYKSSIGYVTDKNNSCASWKHIRKADPEKKLREEAERKAKIKATEFLKDKGYDYSVPAILEPLTEYILNNEGK